MIDMIPTPLLPPPYNSTKVCMKIQNDHTTIMYSLTTHKI